MTKDMTGTADFLIEIGTEELPPKALSTLAAAFASQILDGINKSGLAYTDSKIFATPRRLAVLVSDLQKTQPDRDVERRGPSVKIAFADDGTPTKAAEAFAKTSGVPVDELARIETPKGEWLFHKGKEPGKTAEELLPGIVTGALDALPIPRRMRWGDGSVEFVRPIHWVLMLLGNQTIAASIYDIESGNITRGHRFLSQGDIVIKKPADYAAALEKKGCVIADPVRRKAMIQDQVDNAANQAGGIAVCDDALLDEVAALVEWPVAVTGSFDPDYLDLPPEVLISTLTDHQRYFPIRDKNGDLIANFVTIANLDSKEPDQVRAGNERVVRPRLADAAFFWAQDKKRSLQDRRRSLQNVLFQAKLGSVLDKSEHVKVLVRSLSDAVGADVDAAVTAAELAKCDLVTDMVGEFPGLQGVMGRYYAIEVDQVDPEIATAIEEQYKPRFAGDTLPETKCGRVLAIADKLDTIVGIFAAGLKPTGNRDPFGLRRSALGLLRILIECGIDIDLPASIDISAALKPIETDDAVHQSIYEFIMDRLRAYYLDADTAVTPEMIEAVMANRPASPLDFHQRLQAVKEFTALDAAKSLAAANKRIVNILRKADEQPADAANPEFMTEPAEIELFDAIGAMRDEVTPLLAARDYTAVLKKLSGLRDTVDRFFDDVMVMDENKDRRLNRLALLDSLRQLFLHTADISRLPGP
jgi:glycyl-tRNA synthetase beta chain